VRSGHLAPPYDDLPGDSIGDHGYSAPLAARIRLLRLWPHRTKDDLKLDREQVPGNFIRAFAGGQVCIGEHRFASPLIVTAEAIIADWRPADPESLQCEDLQPVLALQPEVILLGTGLRQRFPQAATLAAVLRQGVGVEVMTTAAACRTFNVLVSEYRRVAAALFPT
jgi:uncharacterized protein